MALVKKYGLVVGAVVLFVAGLVLVMTTPLSFGWSAYAPLSDVTFSPFSPGLIVGWVLVVIGLVLAAGWVGFRLGRRRA